MGRCLAVLTIILGITSVSFAQAPDTLWTNTFGGSGIERSRHGIQVSDGGYLIVGYTTSFGAGSDDVWIVKATSSGAFDWYSVFGGENADRAYSVTETADGGFLVGGYTLSYGAGGIDGWVIKTDASGTLVWEKTYGGSADDVVHSVIQCSDGNYIFCGSTASQGAGMRDAWLVKADTNGNIIWEKTYGDAQENHGRRVIQVSDGGYAIAGGTTNRGGDLDMWIIKTDSSGNLVWESSPGGSDDDFAWAIAEALDGGFIVTGRTVSFSAGGNDLWLVKTDNTCAVEWDEAYGGVGNEYGRSVIVMPDSGYVLSGWTSTWGAGDLDIYLLRTDDAGTLIWDFFLGGTSLDAAEEVVRTADGGYVIFGYTDNWGAGGNDYWLIKTEPDQTGVEAGFTPTPGAIELSVQPNPFSSYLEITYGLPASSEVNLAIYDVSGRRVMGIGSSTSAAGIHSTSVGTEWLPVGCYEVVLRANGEQAVSRCVKAN